LYTGTADLQDTLSLAVWMFDCPDVSEKCRDSKRFHVAYWCKVFENGCFSGIVAEEYTTRRRVGMPSFAKMLQCVHNRGCRKHDGTM
jgi:hypothetical protein